MISLRAWLTTRPGKPISRKRSAFIRLAAQSAPSTRRFIAVFRLCARIIKAHHAALAPNRPDGSCPPARLILGLYPRIALHHRMDFLALAAPLAPPPNHLVAGVFAVGDHAEQFVGALAGELLRRERQLRGIAQYQL